MEYIPIGIRCKVFFSEPLAVCHGAGGRGQRSEVRGQRATNDTNLHELGEDRGQRREGGSRRVVV